MGKHFLPFLISVFGQFVSNAQAGILIRQQSCANGIDDAFFAYYDDFGESVTLFDFVKNGTITPDSKSVFVNITSQTFFHFSRDFDIYPMYLLPGDTIDVECASSGEYKYKFGGSRSHAELILLALVNKKFGYVFPNNSNLEISEKLDYEYIYQRSKEKYVKSIEFVTEYSEQNAITKSYYDIVTNDLRFNFYFALLFPYLSTKVKDETPRLVPESYKTILRKLIDEVDDQYIHLRGYKQFVRALNRFLTVEQYGHVDFFKEIETAKSKFDGETKDYIIFRNLLLDSKKQVTDYSSILLNAKLEIKNPKYLGWIESQLSNSRHAFSKEELSTQLTDITQGITNWESAIKKNLGSIVYVDIWASWCAPCIAEFPYSEKLIARYKDENVKFIFISIDEDSEKWMRSLTRNIHVTESVDHYRMDKSSGLCKFLDIPPIPRYLVIDRTGRIVSLDAYRPSEPLLISEIDKLLGR